ncbi:MAG: PHB depolymerase family esterase [Myxococcales bacterium]|jgi:poly(3-hydroxybutyrate) depolymerase
MPSIGESPAGDLARACGAALDGQPGRQTVGLQHGGGSRSYILHVPGSYDGTSPRPLVLYFHPLLSNASAAATSSGFAELADREGFIVAFPDSAQSAAWNVGGICCTSSPDIDDVGFARAIVDDVESRFCVDAKRVYASGFSMGGGLTHHLGCEAADVFAAIAPGAFDLFEESACAPSRPITVIAFRGTADIIVPFDGGLMAGAPNGFLGNHTFEGAEDSFARWAQINGCTAEPIDEGGGCRTHTTCDDGTEVTLCTALGGGHDWPDAPRAWQKLSRFSLP